MGATTTRTSLGACYKNKVIFEVFASPSPTTPFSSSSYLPLSPYCVANWITKQMKNRFVQSTRSRQVAYPPLHERGIWGERQALLVSVCVLLPACARNVCVCASTACQMNWKLHAAPRFTLPLRSPLSFCLAACPLATLSLLAPLLLASGNSHPPGSSLSACPLATLCRRSFYYFDYSLSPHCLSACLPTCWQLPPSSCSLATLRRRSFYYFEHAAHVSSLSPVGTGCSCCRFRFVILRDTPGRTPLAPPLPPTSPTCLITLLCAKNNKQSSSRGSIKTVEHSRGYIKITAIVDEVQPHTPCYPPLHNINIKKKT